MPMRMFVHVSMRMPMRMSTLQCARMSMHISLRMPIRMPICMPTLQQCVARAERLAYIVMADQGYGGYNHRQQSYFLCTYGVCRPGLYGYGQAGRSHTSTCGRNRRSS